MGIQLSQLHVRRFPRAQACSDCVASCQLLETWRFMTVRSTTRELRSQFKASFGGVVWGQQAAANT